MNADCDRDYFHRRAAQERGIANSSEDNAVALAHLRMADEYERRARELAHGIPNPMNLSGL
jgi:hypothetical protein